MRNGSNSEREFQQIECSEMKEKERKRLKRHRLSLKAILIEQGRNYQSRAKIVGARRPTQS